MAEWKKIQWSDDAGSVVVRKNSGANIGTRPRLNFIEGSNITLAISDDAGSDEIDISIASGGVTYTHPSARQCTTGNWAWASITGKPSTYPPSVHENSHESGGSDAIEFDSLADGGTYKKLLATERTKLAGIATGADIGVFEEATNIISEKSAGGYDNDFVIGSPQLADDGDTAHDCRMFFDKSKGAFRAGAVTSTEWDDANIGMQSIAFGYNCKASAVQSFACGYGGVASGPYSVALSGGDAVASGCSSLAEGDGTLASGDTSHAEGDNTKSSGIVSHSEGSYTIASGYGTHAGGRLSEAYIKGQSARACGRFSENGDAQYSTIVVMKSTSDATQTELIVDTIETERMVLPASRTWAFNILIAARQTGGVAGTVGDSAGYEIKGVVKRDGSNSTALVGPIMKTIIGEDQSAWDATVVADDTNEALVVKVTGEASKTIHWVATVNITEVG